MARGWFFNPQSKDNSGYGVKGTFLGLGVIFGVGKSPPNGGLAAKGEDCLNRGVAFNFHSLKEKVIDGGLNLMGDRGGPFLGKKLNRKR